MFLTPSLHIVNPNFNYKFLLHAALAIDLTVFNGHLKIQS